MLLRVNVLGVLYIQRLLIVVASWTSMIIDYELSVLLGSLYELQILRDRHVVLGMHRYALQAFRAIFLDAVQIDALRKVYVLYPVALVHGGPWIRQILDRIVDGVDGSLVAQVLRDVIGVFANLDILVIARHVHALRAVRDIVAYQLPSVGESMITQGAVQGTGSAIGVLFVQRHAVHHV